MKSLAGALPWGAKFDGTGADMTMMKSNWFGTGADHAERFFTAGGVFAVVVRAPYGVGTMVSPARYAFWR